MMEAVYKTPVMALIDAGHASFELYDGGIYEEPECKEGELDHVLQVVGYGSEGGNDYWICKNSWGKYKQWLAFVRACVVGVRLVLIGIMCRSIY